MFKGEKKRDRGKEREESGRAKERLGNTFEDGWGLGKR